MTATPAPTTTTDAQQRTGRWPSIPAEWAISRREAAERLDICLNTLDRWCARGVIRSARVEGRRLIPASEIDRLLFDARTGRESSSLSSEDRALGYADALANDLAEMRDSWSVETV